MPALPAFLKTGLNFMQVIQVCPAFFPYHGGLETHVEEISKHLTNSGFTVKIYTTDPSGRLPKKQTIEGLEIFRFRAFSPNRVYFFAPGLYSALKRIENAQIIHAHGYPNFPALAAALAKSGNGKPFILTPHYGGYDVQTLGTSTWRIFAKKSYNFSMGRYILSRANAVVTVAKFEREILKQKFGVDDDRITYIPNGVNVASFKIVPKNEEDTKTILYVGRLERYKGIHFLIEAFKVVKTIFPNSRLIIVGSGAYKENLIHLTSSLGLQKSVSFLENIPKEHLTQLYRSSSVFVSLSQYEGQPIALIEAMAYGLPVIATNVGALPEFIQNAKNGFLLNFPPNKKELVDLITSLLENPDSSTKIGFEARNSILSRFSWEKTVKSLIKLYEQFS